MKNLALQPVADQINALYEGGLSTAESTEAAQNLMDFVGLLLEIARENEVDLDDV